MQFRKIRWIAKERSVALTWADATGGDTIEHTLTSTDAPRPEFMAALRELRRYVQTICECESWGVALRPIGVSLSVSKEGDRGVVITCLRNVAIVAAPLVLNTPHVTEDAWPTGLAMALATLELEAELYVHGNRAQATLFGESSAVSVEPEVTRPAPGRSKRRERVRQTVTLVSGTVDA